MVSAVYLFIGQDSFSKDIKLKKIKQEFFSKETEQFNLDVLYAREINLRDLQERLLSLPVKAKKRLIVIKNAQELKEEIREFILKYVKNPYASILLILDINTSPLGQKAGLKQQDTLGGFIRRITRYVEVLRFREEPRLDAFTLSRSIDYRQPEHALRVLNRLLENGERHERILGGLRYVWERGITHPLERRKRLKLLLNCDIDIKTGRLKAGLALEKLVVNLCCLGKSFG